MELVCRVTVLVIVSGFICHCDLQFQIGHLRGESECASVVGSKTGYFTNQRTWLFRSYQGYFKALR